MTVEFGVLGPVTAWDGAGTAIGLKGPRHRAVLARLIAARGRVVPLAMLIDDLWDEPPAGAVGAVRTFVGDLRRALEPDRLPRTAARVLVTEGSGYALRSAAGAVDAVRFEETVAAVRTLPPSVVLETLDRALAWWRGPAYADFGDAHWARAERSRLTETRLHAVELRAGARLELGLAAEAVPELDAHVAEHPWREEGWRLLAVALYRTGRQANALTVLRGARTLLAEELGLEPGAALRQLEHDILHQSQRLDVPTAPDTAADRVWAEAAASYDRTVAAGSRARLRSTVDLLRSLAVTGGSGLEAARSQRLPTILAAEELGDPELTARVIGGYDVPAIWTRSDDPDQAAGIVAAAERSVASLPSGTEDATRARLLATIAVESRGGNETRGARAAREAERIARRLNDPALLAFALNAVFLQTFYRAGLAERRDAIGAELVTLSARHGLVTYEVLGQLVRLQARSAVGDVTGADRCAAAADRLAERYESPLVSVFTSWQRALRLALTGEPPAVVAAAYRSAAVLLDGAGMPGVQRGLLPLALLGLRLQHRQPAAVDDGIEWGPYEPWARPLVLFAQDRRSEAAESLRQLPDPPPDHLLEALWCLAARAAIAVGDRNTMQRAFTALTPAAAEFAGAGSGLFTTGPVSAYLADLGSALGR